MSLDAGVRRRGCAPASSAARRRQSPLRVRGDEGAVTAEAAVVMPVLVALVMGLVWLLALAVAQVRVVDGAREAARLAARGDMAGARVAAVRVAPEGAALRMTTQGDRSVATVSADFRGPGGLFAALPGVTLTWRAEAVQEPR